MAQDFLGLFQDRNDGIRLSPGAVLFEKGDPGDCMYVVRSGQLQISDGDVIYEVVSPGGLVGEMAIVDGLPRSAAVRALTEAEVIPVSQESFLLTIQQSPFFAIRMMQVLSQRLRAMDELVTRLGPAA